MESMLQNHMVIGDYPEPGRELSRAEEAAIDAAMDEAAHDIVEHAMRSPDVADALIAEVAEWNGLEDAGIVLRGVLNAISRHREPASCITAEERMDAMLAEIKGVLESTLGATYAANHREEIMDEVIG